MIERIDSATNKKIKLAASLHNRRHRDKEGLFVVEGIRLSEMAAVSGWPISFALCTSKAIQEPRVKKILAVLAGKDCPVYETSEEIYRKASATETPQGLLLVMGQQQARFEDMVLPGKQAFLLVLDGVQDPGNAGAMIRTADAAGCSGIVLLKDNVDLFSDKTVRATMGSLFHLPVIQKVNMADLQAFLKENDIRLLAAALDSSAQPHFQADFCTDIAIVFGNEGNGISAEMLQAADNKVYIPMFGQAESLNVATAAAIVLYEAIRQRHSQ